MMKLEFFPHKVGSTMFLLFLIAFSNFVLAQNTTSSVNATEPTSFSVETSKSHYSPAEKVSVILNVSQTKEYAPIFLNVTSPKGQALSTTVLPSLNGSGRYSFQLLNNAPLGSWKLSASYKNSRTSTSFNVSLPEALMQKNKAVPPKVYFLDSERQNYHNGSVVRFAALLQGNPGEPMTFTIVGPNGKDYASKQSKAGFDGFATADFSIEPEFPPGHWTLRTKFMSLNNQTSFEVSPSTNNLTTTTEQNRSAQRGNLSMIPTDRKSYKSGEVIPIHIQETTAISDPLYVSLVDPHGNTRLLRSISAENNASKTGIPTFMFIPKSAETGKWKIITSKGNLSQQESFNVTGNNLTSLKAIKNFTSLDVMFTDSGKNTNALIKNTGKSNVTAFILKLKTGTMKSVNANNWNVTLIDNTTALLLSKRPLRNQEYLVANLELSNDTKLPLNYHSKVGDAGAQIGPAVLFPFDRPYSGMIDTSLKLKIKFQGNGQGALVANGRYCSSTSVTPCVIAIDFPNWVTIVAWANRETSLFDPRKDWGGDCGFLNNDEFPSEFFETGTASASFQVDHSMTCSITFNNFPSFRLAMDIKGNGIGAVFGPLPNIFLPFQRVPQDIHCGTRQTGACSAYFSTQSLGYERMVTLKAVPAAESTFVGWGIAQDAPKGGIRTETEPEMEYLGGRPIGCEGNSPVIEVWLTADSVCTAFFEPAEGITPPSTSQPVSPELISLSRSIIDNYGYDFGDLGWPVRTESPTESISQFQLFRSQGTPFLNSAETYRNDDGATCTAISITPKKAPYWYDEYWAFDSDIIRVLPRGLYPTGEFLDEPGMNVHLRQWAQDDRSFRQFRNDINRSPQLWPSTFPPYSVADSSITSPTYPPGRGPAPKWFFSCMAEDSLSTSSILQATSNGVSNSGFVCDYIKPDGGLVNHHNGVQGDGPPAWAMINPVYKDGLFPVGWQPDSAEGILTNSFLAGHDVAKTHWNWPTISNVEEHVDIQGIPGPAYNPHALSGRGYWLGVTSPYYYTSSNTEGNCDWVSDLEYAGGQLCNDWNGQIWLDPPFKRLLSVHIDNPYTPEADELIHEKDNLIVELEQWLMPSGYRPEPGDRIYVVGRLAADCAEMVADPNQPIIPGGPTRGIATHTELHPFELITSSYLQTSQPSKPVDQCFGIFESCTRNMPPISYEWHRLTNDEQATLTKLVVTSYWQGETLEFDIWPPPRPSIDASLNWDKEIPGIMQGPGVEMNIEPIPSSNPNHLHVTIKSAGRTDMDIKYEGSSDIVSAGSPCHYRTIFDTISNECTLWGKVKPEIDRRIVNAFLLWWENH
jgi:hypothetical protein